MSKKKSALNSRKGGGKKTASSIGITSRIMSNTEIRAARRSNAALRARMSKNAKASSPTPAEKRHAGLGRQ
jgi:hypothetical protein